MCPELPLEIRPPLGIARSAPARRRRPAAPAAVVVLVVRSMTLIWPDEIDQSRDCERNRDPKCADRERELTLGGRNHQAGRPHQGGVERGRHERGPSASPHRRPRSRDQERTRERHQLERHHGDLLLDSTGQRPSAAAPRRRRSTPAALSASTARRATNSLEYDLQSVAIRTLPREDIALRYRITMTARALSLPPRWAQMAIAARPDNPPG
jgi:hypothetical protein